MNNNSKSQSILNGFKGIKKQNGTFKEICKGVIELSKLDNSNYDIFSAFQIKKFVNQKVQENIGLAKEVQKSIVDSVKGDLAKLVVVNGSIHGKIKPFYISNKGECSEILKAMQPINDDNNFEDSFDEEEVLDFISKNNPDDDALINEFGDDIVDFINQLESDGKIEVTEENTYAVVEDNGSQDGEGEGSQNQNGEGEGSQNGEGEGEGSQNGEGEGEGSQNQNGEGEGSQNQNGEGEGEGSQNGEGEGSNTNGGGTQEINASQNGEGEGEGSQNQNGEGEGSQNGEGEGSQNGEGEGSQNGEGEGEGLSQNGEGEGSQNGEGEGSQNGEGEGNIFEEGSQNGEGEGEGSQNGEGEGSQNGEGEGEGLSQNGEGEGEEYTPEELEAMASKTATATLIKFYQNSNDEDLKNVAAIELRKRNVDVASLEEGNDPNLPDTKKELQELENWTKDYLGKYDKEDLVSFVTTLALKSPEKRKELKEAYREFYSASNNGNKALKVDEKDLEDFLENHYFNNFTIGDLQSYAFLMISKDKHEYKKIKKLYDEEKEPLI